MKKFENFNNCFLIYYLQINIMIDVTLYKECIKANDIEGMIDLESKYTNKLQKLFNKKTINFYYCLAII